MDPFEVRMTFLSSLRKLNASQTSIQKAVGYAIKYFPSCGEDLWDCIVEECQKGSINSRINILYFLDSLCETCLLVRSRTSAGSSKAPPRPDDQPNGSQALYMTFVSRDLTKIVESVVPEGRQGLPNLVSTKQILENWRTKRVIDPSIVDGALTTLSTRHADASTSSETTPRSSRSSQLNKNEALKRIEEDRERHKRLRERRWVQPVSHVLELQSQNRDASSYASQLSCFMPLTNPGDGEEELRMDIEFENEWETTSDWNEDDEEVAGEEDELCFPAEGEGPMDLS